MKLERISSRNCTPDYGCNRHSFSRASRMVYRENPIIPSASSSDSSVNLGKETLGGICLTNDGNAILREIIVQHPAAKSLIEIARTQDEEVRYLTFFVRVNTVWRLKLLLDCVGP